MRKPVILQKLARFLLGGGFDQVDRYVDAIREIIADEGVRQRTAVEAIDYVKRVHDQKCISRSGDSRL